MDESYKCQCYLISMGYQAYPKKHEDCRKRQADGCYDEND